MVSALGFGCGPGAGLMIHGAPKDQEQAVARALELGINFFARGAAHPQCRHAR